jgi:hypothetical protein
MSEFQIRLNRRGISDDELIEDMRRCAAELSKDTVTAAEYGVKGNFGVRTILRRFNQWNLALQKAGLTAPNRQNIPNAELFENIANVWTGLGRQPYGRELEKAYGLSNISLGTYEDRFGSWNNALLAFETFIKSGRPTEAEAEPTGLPMSLSNKRTGSKVNWRLRAQVLIRDNCICQMCGASPAKNSDVVLHADHIKPWSKGGETVLENLRTLCLQCNIGKSDMHDDGLLTNKI